MASASARPARSTGRGARIARNAGALSLAKVASDLGSIALFVALSRVYGQEGIGQYSFAMALTGCFALLGDFGLYPLTIKEIARRPGNARRHLGQVLVMRLLLSGASFALLLAVLPWLPLPAEGRVVVVLLGLFQLAYRLTYGLAAAFVAEERMGAVAGLEIGLRAASAAGGVGLACSGASLVSAVAVLPAVAWLEVGVALALVVRRYGAPRLRGAWGALPGLARRALPYGASSLLFQLQGRMDVLLLGILVGTAATGSYSAACRVVLLLAFLNGYAATAFFPAASQLFAEDPAAAARLCRRALRGFVWLAVPAAAGLALVADELVGIVYGPAFATSVPVLQGLAALLLLMGLRDFASFFLMSADLQVERVKCQGIAAGAGLALHATLIPWLGVLGAVAATLAAEALLAALLLRALARRLGSAGLLPRLAASAGASACFCLPVLFWLPPLPLWVVVPVSMAVYGLALGVAAWPARELSARAARRARRRGPAPRASARRSAGRAGSRRRAGGSAR